MVSKRRQVIEKWLDGYKNPDRNTPGAFRTPDCKHIVPSVQNPILWNNDQTAGFFSQFEGIIDHADITVQDWLDDDKSNKISILFTLKMHFRPSLDLEPYVGKYYIIFTFNEDQTLYSKFVELVDYANTPNYLAKVNEGREKLGLGPLQLPSS